MRSEEWVRNESTLSGSTRKTESGTLRLAMDPPPPSVTRLSTQPRDATPPAARPTPGNSRKAEPHSIQSQLHAPLLYDCLPNRLSVPNSAILPISLLPLSNGMKGASVMGLSPPVGPHPVALS